MRRLPIIWSLALLPFAVAAAAYAGTPLSDDDCAAAWAKAGGANLSPDKAKPFVVSFEQVDVDHDGAINWEEFKAGCKAGLVEK